MKGNHECSNMVANILLTDPSPSALGVIRWVQTSIGQNSALSEHGHVAYQITWNPKCSNMVANILPTDLPPPPPPHPSERVHRSKFNFENMVMLHIKLTGITEYRNMIANVLLAKLPPPPRILGQKVKIQLFQNNVRLHIKLKGITNAAK